MAKDDYFVIVYQVLKYLYEQLKKGEKIDKDYFKEAPIEINKKYWHYIIENMLKQEYITGIIIKETKDKKIYYYNNIEITPKGIEYLFDNNLMSKAKKALEGIKDIASIFPI
ncbi:MAG: YjcQ family protein [Tissierellia bacterium]|nr:YjcQ family protein [Tissierellia bacterium]